jgi:hypothetical protein
MRHQRLGRHAAVNRAFRRRGNDHSPLAEPAGVTRTRRDTHAQLRGHDIELLRAQFADRMQCGTAARAIRALDVEQHFIPRQVG